uniref:transmembrane protein 230-like isoform X2 n=1 Tax=Erigeron canadensis TaxID=72917 RepID=UPI001CB9669B|nr:transmembrane protein 230-like isoform X2 [Erigeron canadensis]
MQNKKNYYRFGVKHRRLKPLLPTHLPPPFNSFPNCQFEIGLDACGILELLFNNSELESVDMTSRRNINYSRLAVDEDNTGREATFDPRFDLAPERSDKVPWKAVALALFLLFFGCVLLLLSLFIFTGHMGGDRAQAYGLLGLGTLTFLPGFYETRIAYYSWRGAQGYHFTAIPSY